MMERVGGVLNQTTFEIPKMDCPSEEKVIRMALDGSENVRHLTFDLSTRRLVIVHVGQADRILSALLPLGFGARISETRTLSESEQSQLAPDKSLSGDDESETKVLRLLLAINAAMFIIELSMGLFAQSTGLIADSLDMFADAAVYGVSLYAVGKAINMKRRAARMSGYLQILLALGALVEVVRRFYFGSEPESDLMMGVAALALIVNVSCMALLSRHREGEVHMKASWIFSTNDVIANVGVILAGALVGWLNTNWPDLIVGLIIAFVVFNGGRRILKISVSSSDRPAGMATH